MRGEAVLGFDLINYERVFETVFNWETKWLFTKWSLTRGGRHERVDCIDYKQANLLRVLYSQCCNKITKPPSPNKLIVNCNVLILLFQFQARAGRIYDAVLTITKAIRQLLTPNISETTPPVTNELCPSLRKNVEPGIDGYKLLEAMKKVTCILLSLTLFMANERKIVYLHFLINIEDKLKYR